MLGTDLLAPSALDAVGRPAAGGGVDDVIIVVRVPVVVDLLRVHGGEAVGDRDVLLGLEEGGGQLVRQDIALARVAARQTLAQGQLALALQIAAGRVEVVKARVQKRVDHAAGLRRVDVLAVHRQAHAAEVLFDLFHESGAPLCYNLGLALLQRAARGEINSVFGAFI